MSVAASFANYQSSTPPSSIVAAALAGKGSPNLAAILAHLERTYDGQSLGYGPNPRAIRGGTAPSTHAYGAALDWRYMDTTDASDPTIESYMDAHRLMDWLVDHSAELGIQAIHDYWGDRIWRAWRSTSAGGPGWKKQNGAGSGMGESWAKYVHIEVHPSAWFDGRSVDERVTPPPPVVVDTPPVTPPPPTAPPTEETHTVQVDNLRTLRPIGAPNQQRGRDVRLLKSILNGMNTGLSHADELDKTDDGYDLATIRRVMDYQAFRGLKSDGICGPITWGSLLNDS